MWKIFVKMGIFPQVGMKIKNIYKYLKPPPRKTGRAFFVTFHKTTSNEPQQVIQPSLITAEFGTKRRWSACQRLTQRPETKLPQIENLQLFVNDNWKLVRHWKLGVPKMMGFPTQITHFNRVFHYKSSILEYPLFLETPIWWWTGPLKNNMQSSRCSYLMGSICMTYLPSLYFSRKESKLNVGIHIP